MKAFKLISYKGLGSIIAGIIGIKQGKKQIKEGNQKIGESDKLIPDEVDSEQRLAYNRIDRKRDSYYSGSYASSMQDELNQNYANLTEGALSLASGGGSDVTALLRQGKTVGQAFNQVTGAIENKGMAYEQEGKRQLEGILQRKLELQLMKHQEKRYDGQSLLQAGLQNKSAGVAAVGSGIDDIINTATSLIDPLSLLKEGGKDAGARVVGVGGGSSGSSSSQYNRGKKSSSFSNDCGDIEGGTSFGGLFG